MAAARIFIRISAYGNTRVAGAQRKSPSRILAEYDDGQIESRAYTGSRQDLIAGIPLLGWFRGSSDLDWIVEDFLEGLVHWPDRCSVSSDCLRPLVNYPANKNWKWKDHWVWRNRDVSAELGLLQLSMPI